MPLTQQEVQNAMVQYAKGTRPLNFRKPKPWYIVDETGQAYPLKAVYAMATNETSASFNTGEAREALEALGFNVCNFDGPGVSFEKSVRQSLKSKRSERQARLKAAARKPTQPVVQTLIYERNSDVVAEVRDRAKGSELRRD